MYKRILVPVDGSSTSDLAVNEALRLAASQQAELCFIHVLEDVSMAWYGGGYVEVGQQLESAQKESGEHILNKAVDEAAQAGITAEAKLLGAGGERAARVIVAEAQKWPADIIVLGTHGRSGFDHLLFGSVAESVVRIATTPVLLIREVERRQPSAA